MQLRFVMLLSMAALLHGCSATFLRTSCDNPRISNFGSPSSYMVMLPYRYGGHNNANRKSALELNKIVRLQALQGAVAMPETQITLVEGDADVSDDPACDIESVYDRVVESSSGRFWRRPFHSAVFVWGEIFDQGDGLVVQSHLRVFWNGRSDREFEVSVDSPMLVRPLRFGGNLPLDTISFPAQRIPRVTQERLASAITEGLQVRSAPNLDSARVELPKRFAATHWKSPWLELQGRDLSSVWLLIDERGLDTGVALPETLFARAMTSYLNFRVHRDSASRTQVVESLARFRSEFGHVEDPMLRVPLAVADVIVGTLGLPVPVYQTPTFNQTITQETEQTIPSQAQSILVDAARRLPSNADVLNLAAIARIPGCCDGEDAPARILEIQLLLERADALEHGNLKVGRNLLNWYLYLATIPETRLPFARDELVARTRNSLDSLAAWSRL